tara:strand:- start:917 stop:1150 length:234 start_codon:yes stop_codon:yes gene_type:complete
MSYTQSKLSQNYKVDERYRQSRGGSDNNSGLSFLRGFTKNLNFRPGSSTDTDFPPSIDNSDTRNIKNVMKKSSNYFS